MHIACDILDSVFDDIQEAYPTFDKNEYRDILADHDSNDNPVSHLDGDLVAWVYVAHKFLSYILETELQFKSWKCGFADWASSRVPSQGFLQFLSKRLAWEERVTESQYLTFQTLNEIRLSGTLDSSLLAIQHGSLFKFTIDKLDFLMRSLKVLDYARIIDRHFELRKLKHEAAFHIEKTVDTAQTILDDRKSGLNHTERKELEDMLYKAARNHGVLPSKFYIEDVLRLDEHPIGGGSYGDVYMGRVGRLDVAVKVSRFLWDPQEKERRYRDLCREALIWKPLKHPYILPFFGLCDEGFPSVGLVSPFMHNGDLLTYLKRNTRVNKRTIMEQICLGLEYLHRRKPPIVHGDLKCTNVLVDHHGNPRIADFGLARLMGVTSRTTSSGNKGTLRWQAPEIIYPSVHGGDGRVNVESDIYAFGMACLEIFSEKVPFHDMTDWEVAMMARDGSILEHVLGTVKDAWIAPILECCCAIDPSARFQMKDILENIFWAQEFRTIYTGLDLSPVEL